jgi:hypothetical protein
MIKRVEGMPPGAIGLRSSGELTKDDYVDVLEPALREGIDSGELRLLFVIDDYDGVAPGAWLEDVKTGVNAWFGGHDAWRRFAFVTDVEWLAKAMRMFAWMVPGEVKVCGLSEEEEAKRWVAG